MKRALLVSLLLSFIALALFAFSPATGASDRAKPVTFSKDVAPILFKNCASCHRPNDIAPMSLMSYKESRPWARSIKEKVVTREMPPWHADPSHGEFANDSRLTQDEINTVVAWVDQGAKEGDPKDLPPAPAADDGWELGKPDLVLSMPEPYKVEASGPDDYIYFRIPTGFKEDRWIQAAEFKPGNKRVVHHAVVFIETPDMLDAARTLAKRRGKAPGAHGEVASVFEADEGGIFEKVGTTKRVKADVRVVDDACGAPPGHGGGGAGGNELLCVYAPGRNADVWPTGTAKRVPAGSNIIFQMHYSKTTGKPETDQTILGLYFAKEPVQKMISTVLVTNFLFKIPAGADNHLVTACQTFNRDVELVNYMPHMHVRGKDMRYEIEYPDGRRETLLDVPRYDFNWQTLYKLKRPLPVPKGSKIIVTAHFDNSARNKMNPDATKAVRFGEPTDYEMMVGFVDFIRDKPKERVIAKLDPKVYDAYVGEYAIPPVGSFQVRRDGDKLLLEARGQSLQVYPTSETSFFLKAAEADLNFVKNEKGEVVELVLEMNGRIIKAQKVNKPATAATK
ncbi:MAG TPA: DUF3471 domain-containing protein [Blastocatellia bacterium]|nr:DUF3471 domain-containing protein [Blastocatellia bacterium]